MADLTFCVKYPFSRAAKTVLEQSGIQVSDSIIERSLSRITTALEEGKLQKGIALHENEKLEEIASYAASRMILGYAKNRYLTNKYAVAESKRASAYLEGEEKDTVDALGNEFGIVTQTENNVIRIPIYTYLACSPRSVDYKIINREIENGYVVIKPREKIRLIEEAIRKHMERIPLVKDPPEKVKGAAEKLKELLLKIEPKEAPVAFTQGDLPPCIEKLMESIKKHENLPHQARWYLAVYLLKNRVPLEDIVAIYSNLPDYNEKITRYQLEHAKKKEYAVPACATVMTWGLCCAECRIGSPLNWGSLPKDVKERIGKTGKR